MLSTTIRPRGSGQRASAPKPDLVIFEVSGRWYPLRPARYR
jgi:hypothetical protein